MSQPQIKHIVHALDHLAPTYYREDFDNVGLLVGDPQQQVTGVLVCHDCLEEVIEEAIRKNCNMIVSFHPIIFKGLKSLTGANYVERAVILAIRHNIAIYAIHTALDKDFYGVNRAMCQALGLENARILIPDSATLKKLTTYVPVSHLDTVKEALFAAGAGQAEDYERCSFEIEGTGSFKAKDGAKPFVGGIAEQHFEKETMLNLVFATHLQSKVVNALLKSHPYQTPAYEILTLDNKNPRIGMGMIGDLTEELSEGDFLELLKTRFLAQGIRHSAVIGKTIKKVAVLGGSGSFAIQAAKNQNADAFVSADLKYHDFFSADGCILMADIGHFESERFTKNILLDYLRKKFTNFALCLSESNTNPINYYK